MQSNALLGILLFIYGELGNYMTTKNILLLLFTIIFSGISVFFRKLAVDKIHPYQIQIIAGIFYAALIPLWIFLMSKESITFNTNIIGNVYGILALTTYVLSAVILGIIFKSTNSPGAISAIVAANPLITLSLCVLFLGEEITIKKVVGSIVVVFGIGLLK